MNNPHETTVQDRHRELASFLAWRLAERLWKLLPGPSPEDLRNIHDKYQETLLAALTERGEHEAREIQELTSERDRLKDGFLFCLGECDGKFWKEHSEEVKSAWEVAQELSAKHDGGGA